MIEKLFESVKWIFDGWGITLIEKLFSKSKDNDRLVINIGDVNIKNINLADSNNNILKDYELLIRWLRNEGKDIMIGNLGAEFSKSFIDYVNSLPDKVNNFDKISLIANHVKNIKIFENSFINKNLSFKRLVGQLENPEERVRDRIVYEIGREYLKETNKDFKEIFDKNLEKNNIGGIIFFLQTNILYDNKVIVTPEILGFERIEDEDALVNLALNNKVSISKVKLVNGNNYNEHKVHITIRNLTNKTIRFKIPKGQIFENKNFEDDLQNLTISEDRYEKLLPNKKKRFKIDAFCLNEDKSIPEGVNGNIAIYRIKDRSFVNGEDLWQIMRDKKNEVFGDDKNSG